METKLYKGKYFLAVYDLDDNLIDTFDNCHQLASWLHTTVASAACSVGRCLNGHIKSIVCDNKKYKVYAFEV